jgi:hypothetical protein
VSAILEYGMRTVYPERARDCEHNDRALSIGQRVFNTGRVQVGLLYRPSVTPAMDADSSLLQKALTDPRTAQPQTLPRRFLGFILREVL